MVFYLKQFAADYDCNAYGSGDYNNSTCATSSGGGLSDTGTNVMPALVGGVLLVTIALAIIVRMIVKKKRQA
jgi:hypothetical protein